MARACMICRHSRRTEIDAALVRSDSFRHIAAQFAVSTGALQRHRPRLLREVEYQTENRPGGTRFVGTAEETARRRGGHEAGHMRRRAACKRYRRGRGLIEAGGKRRGSGTFGMWFIYVEDKDI